MSWDANFLADVAAIIWLDIVLSGDNALVIGMAAAALAPHLQRKAILFGMILDSSSIMLILVPLMLPVVVPMGVDLVWFGIITVIAVEIGLLTPPFGISVYVIKSTLEDPDIKLKDIFLGAAPFALMMLVCLAAVVFFPVIATGLLGR